MTNYYCDLEGAYPSYILERINNANTKDEEVKPPEEKHIIDNDMYIPSYVNPYSQNYEICKGRWDPSLGIYVNRTMEEYTKCIDDVTKYLREKYNMEIDS